MPHALPMEATVLLTELNVLTRALAQLILLNHPVTMEDQMEFVNSPQPQILAD